MSPNEVAAWVRALGLSLLSSSIRGGTASLPNFASASPAAWRTSSLSSLNAPTSTSIVLSGSPASRPSANAALRRMSAFLSDIALMIKGAVSLASGPIPAMVQMA
jgi:hypothetical protein